MQIISHYSPIVAALVTLLLIAIMLSSSAGKKIQDIPNERSLHTTPTPRIGGIGLTAGVLSGWGLMFSSLTWWILLPLLALFSISLLDDVCHLPVLQRLSVQMIAAAILVIGSGIFTHEGAVVALSVILITVWMTNLYNFMDGSDGLAGGMAMIGFAFYGIAAALAHEKSFALLNFCISAAALGFLRYNFPPAKIFMGDAGSIPLGFLAAAMGLLGWQSGIWEAWFPVLVFSPFIVDASVTLVKRGLRGAKVTEAHREHYYQRTVQLGWSHRMVALFEYVLMLGVGISGLVAQYNPFPWQMLLAWCVIYGVLMLVLDMIWNKFKRGQRA